MKSRLVLGDTDQYYVDKFYQYYESNSKMMDLFSLAAFTDREKMENYLYEQGADIVLADEHMEIDLEHFINIPARVYLTSSFNIATIKNVKAICKYQIFDNIYKEIMLLCSDINSESIVQKMGASANKGTKLFVLQSINGGAGASTIAIALARNIARKHKNVLYLNLELLGDSLKYFKGKGIYDFSEIIYAVQGRKSNLALKIESTARRDASGVFFFEPCQNCMDVLSMNEEDIYFLLENIKNNCTYDYVIVDTSLEMQKKDFKIWDIADRVFIVLEDTNQANDKEKQFIQALRSKQQMENIAIIPKFRRIYNKVSREVNSNKWDREIPVAAIIPLLMERENSLKIEQLSVNQSLERIFSLEE